MAHFLNKKYKTKISDKDYDIISTGRKTILGKDSGAEFGKSSRDYIEMNIFNTNGTLLDSIRLDEPKDYVDNLGNFKINPGIIMRRNGYFSGDYEIEFNFLREVAGSSQSVLVDENNRIYNGEFDVLIDGRIVERGTNNSLREIDYKYYVHQVSNSRKEVRLATLPIKDENYISQFNSLTEQQNVSYAKSDVDLVSLDLTPNNEFRLGENSSIKLDNTMIGGDFVINDAYEIMDLESLSEENDGFEITIGGKGVNTHYGPGGDAYINRGDQDPSNNISFEDTFNQLSIDSDQKQNGKLLEIATEIKKDSGLKLFDGAFMMGFRTANVVGFPFQINTTISDLNKIKFLQPELVVKIKGRDLVNNNEFESTSKQKFNGNGTRGTIPIPTNHKRFGGLYSAEFDLSYELNGVRRGFTIFRPNLFVVIPDYNVSEGSENLRFAEQFVRQGINF